MEKQRIHELGFQNNEEEIFIINDADGDDNFAYGVELKTSNVNQGQLVTGKYNSDRNIDNYAVVVGGGSDELHRRNIYTLDNSGNATFGGTIKVTRGYSTTEVATQQDLRNTAVGKFHSLDEPINITVNLEKAEAGAIQTGGEDIVVGITPDSVLSKAHGGTGRAILDNDNSQQAVLRGDMELVNYTGANTASNPEAILGWDNNKQLGIFPYNAGSGTGVSDALMVDLSQTVSDPTADNPYLGVKNQLPIGKINFNSKEYEGSLTEYHKVPFFKDNGDKAGTSETTFLGLSSLRKILGIPIKTKTVLRIPNDSDPTVNWYGKLGKDDNQTDAVTELKVECNQNLKEKMLAATIVLSRANNSIPILLNDFSTSEKTFSTTTKALGWTTTAYGITIKYTDSVITVTFNNQSHNVLLGVAVIAIMEYESE